MRPAAACWDFCPAVGWKARIAASVVVVATSGAVYPKIKFRQKWGSSERSSRLSVCGNYSEKRSRALTSKTARSTATNSFCIFLLSKVKQGA